MSAESLIVYKPVRLVTPDQAGDLGIETNRPVFVDRTYKSFSGDALIKPEVYQPGAVIEATDYSNGERSKILTFPELKTAIDYESVTGYLGSNTPFTGFIAVSEVVGSYSLEPICRQIPDLCVRADRLKVLDVKAFREGIEVEHQYFKDQAARGRSRGLTFNRSGIAYIGIYIDPAGE